MPVRVMGFNVSHDSSACLVEDGIIRTAIGLERTTRVKRGTVPHHVYGSVMADLTREVLASNNLEVTDIDWWVATATEARDPEEESRLVGLLGLMADPDRCVPLPHPGHHLAHASAAFYSSAFDEATALVIDAYGSLVGCSREQESIFHFKTGEEPLTVHQVLRDSERVAGYFRNGELWAPAVLSGVGEIYRVITLALGFQESGTIYDDAGKTMGLASYGKQLSSESLFIKTTPDALQFDQAADSLVELGLAVRAGDELRIVPRQPDSPFEQFHYDLAAQVQLEFEEACLHLARIGVAKTGSRSLVAGGGTFLNSSLNTRLLREAGIDRLFVFPAATDDGNSAGAALYVYHKKTRNAAQPAQLKHVFLGPPRIAGQDLEAAAGRWSLSPRRHDGSEAAAEAAASAIARGEIVGWFQDRSEFGPRSLGARSILCHPGIPGMKDRLNARVKFRESFRPFAASVLTEDADQWFEMPVPESPFMLLVCPVQAHQRQRVSEIVHVDGTCRLQTVSADTPGPFRGLIKFFGAATGIPMVLNTSFNLRGMPIVEHPDDAFDCLYGSRLDRLFIGDLEIAGPDLTSAVPVHVPVPQRGITGAHPAAAAGDLATRPTASASSNGMKILALANGTRQLHHISDEIGVDPEVAVDICLNLRRRGLLRWNSVPETPRFAPMNAPYMPNMSAF